MQHHWRVSCTHFVGATSNLLLRTIDLIAPTLPAFPSQVFLSTANALVTCSKDSAVRVWDLETQHCSQTVVGHKGEVWSLDVDPSETRLVTGEHYCFSASSCAVEMQFCCGLQ